VGSGEGLDGLEHVVERRQHTCSNPGPLWHSHAHGDACSNGHARWQDDAVARRLSRLAAKMGAWPRCLLQAARSALQGCAAARWPHRKGVSRATAVFIYYPASERASE